MLLPFYARQLGAHEYGLLDSTTVLLTLIGTVCAVEIAQGVARFLPESQSTEQRRKIGSTAFWFTALMLGIAAIGLWLVAPWAASFALGAPSHASVLRIASITLLFGGLQGIAVRHLRWSLRARSYVLVVALTNFATAAFGVGLVLHWRPLAESLLWGQAGGNAAGLIASYLLAGKELGLAWDSPSLRRMLRFSAPLVISTLGVIATGQFGRVMLANLGSLEQAGILGVAARLASILSLLVSGLQLAIGPLIYAAHEKPDTPPALAAALRVFTATTLAGWTALTVFAPELVELLTPPSFAVAADLIAPLAGAVILNASITFAPGLEIRHRTGILAIICLCSGLLNLGLCTVLISPFGAQGAAFSALLASTLQAALVFKLSNQHYAVPYPWGAIGSAWVIAVSCTLLSLTLAPHLVFPSLFKLFLVFLCTLLIAWVLLRPLATKSRISPLLR
jgi:O-antigen/teichoic acid export membrane protein